MDYGYARIANEQLPFLDFNQMTHGNGVAAVMFPPSS